MWGLRSSAPCAAQNRRRSLHRCGVALYKHKPCYAPLYGISLSNGQRVSARPRAVAGMRPSIPNDAINGRMTGVENGMRELRNLLIEALKAEAGADGTSQELPQTAPGHVCREAVPQRRDGAANAPITARGTSQQTDHHPIREPLCEAFPRRSPNTATIPPIAAVISPANTCDLTGFMSMTRPPPPKLVN